MGGIGADWRVLDGVLTAWFDARSLTDGAALASRILERTPVSAIDLRATGLRVRLDSADQAEAISAIARALGLAADPTRLQHLSVLLESPNPDDIKPFWQRTLDYRPDQAAELADPLRRDPPLRFRQSADSRPLRNRIHLDVVRPAVAVEQADLGEASGPYGVCHRDPDGNEVDLVLGGALGDGAGVADWQAVFSAMACYRVNSLAQQQNLIIAATRLADGAGFPLMLDLRPGLVILDSGKDQWEDDAHGTGADFLTLAADLQTAARELGAVAELGIPRFVQLFLDAADVATVRAFWVAALGYTLDPRAGVTDIVDPRRLNPVLVFQELDPSETERRRQRNRIHVDVAVPADSADGRIENIVTAGVRVLDESDNHWQISDPEGNELVILGES